MTTCKTLYRQICEHLDERIDSKECRALKSHLAGCPDCRRYLATVKKTVSLYREAPPPKLPAAVRRRLMIALRGEGRNLPQRKTR